ncbi:MAG: hypothetical protein U0Q18_29460 [Bryobacteraceae bacterium]
MNSRLATAALVLGTGVTFWAARCTTVMDSRLLPEYEKYVASAERIMETRFDAGDLAWVPPTGLKDAAAKLASGKLVRWNLTDAALNQTLADRNGAVIHWIGAVRVRHATLADLNSVLEDSSQFVRVYHPMLFDCKPDAPFECTNCRRDLILGMQNSYRFASLFPQHYAFQVKARMEHGSVNGSGLRVRLSSAEIRESESGVPGRSDFLDQYRDHGIMWALNAYWRARQQGPDLYLEFESITLARSAQAFVCKIGIVPVPKSIISAAMDSIPAESATVVLEGTRAECERRARSGAPNASSR